MAGSALYSIRGGIFKSAAGSGGFWRAAIAGGTGDQPAC